MPLYVWRCSEGHEAEEQRPIADRDRPKFCDRCLTVYNETRQMERVVALVAPVFPGAASWRGG